ncbi:MAG TPA: hypothetical protein DCE41_33140 [Cytophagales bacterium]|nr:hypothetical protein [Cytophagales bacterium]
MKAARLVTFLLLSFFATGVQAQVFEFGYGIGLNWSQMRVVDSTAGVRDSVFGNTFEIAQAQTPGYTFMAYGIYHLEKNFDARITVGADWIAGQVNIGREGIGGNLTRSEEQYFEGWFHFAPGIQYTYELIPDLLSVSAGVDVSFGIAAINLLTELPTSDTTTVQRDYYTLTSYRTFQNGFNIFVRPHAQLNLIRKSGRKWTVNVQYDQGIFPYFEGGSTSLNFIDPFTLESVLDSGYSAQGRASRLTVTLGAELPWGTPTKKKPRYWRF